MYAGHAELHWGPIMAESSGSWLHHVGCALLGSLISLVTAG